METFVFQRHPRARRKAAAFQFENRADHRNERARVGHDLECFDGLLESKAHANSELLECLITLGFVVPAGLDEHQREKDRLQQTKADEERLFLTIAPTMACNQRCSYCFQRNTPKTKIMSAEMQQAVIEFVRRKIGNTNQLLIQWFGGEPLVAYGTIVSMTKAFKAICAERSIDYYAEMLTNGTLLTPERVAALRTLDIKALRFPDGMPKTYANGERSRCPRQRPTTGSWSKTCRPSWMLPAASPCASTWTRKTSRKPST